MRGIALLLVLPFSASPQAAKPQPVATIEGKVTNASTGAPIRKVFLHLVPVESGADWTGSYSASSDASGKFVIRNIDPGKYRLRASRSGYLRAEYGARAAERPGAVLNLDASHEMKELDIRLTPHGVITGRILDADGDPVEAARVQLLHLQYRHGRKGLASTKYALTNDVGEYRMAGLVPGRYYLYVENSHGLPPTSEVKEDYVPAYYPGVTDSVGAVALEVAGGAETRTADMILPKARTIQIAGRVVVDLSGTRGVPSVTFSRDLGHDDSATGIHKIYPAKVSATGAFEIRAIPEGRYYAMAEIGKDGMGYTSPPSRVDVTGSDVEDLVLRIGAGIDLTGRIRVEGDAAQELPRVDIRLRQGGPRGAGFVAGSVSVAADGTFRESGLMPDRYGVKVNRLPDGFYLKRVRLGESDVTTTGIDLTSGASGPVELLLSPTAAAISVVAQNRKTGKPAAGATVVMIPEEDDRAGIEEFYHQAVADVQGRATFKSVAPGEYRVFAWEDVESTAWLDPGFMKPLMDKGTLLKVEERSQREIQVDVITDEAK